MRVQQHSQVQIVRGCENFQVQIVRGPYYFATIYFDHLFQGKCKNRVLLRHCYLLSVVSYHLGLGLDGQLLICQRNKWQFATDSPQTYIQNTRVSLQTFKMVELHRHEKKNLSMLPAHFQLYIPKGGQKFKVAQGNFYYTHQIKELLEELPIFHSKDQQWRAKTQKKCNLRKSHCLPQRMKSFFLIFRMEWP